MDSDLAGAAVGSAGARGDRRIAPLSLVVLLLLLVAGGAWYLVSRSPIQVAGQAEIAIPVVVQEVRQRDYPVYMFGLGTVSAFNTVLVRSRVDGRIDSVAFEEGQDVHQGDVLVRIDPRPYAAALHQMEANRKKDQATLDNARLDLARSTALVGRQFAPRQTLDTQRATVSQLEAAIEADDAQIDNAQVLLEYTTITAPISGRTGIRQIDAGNIAHAADPGGFVLLTQLDPSSGIFTLPEKHLEEVTAAIARADKARLRVTALAR